MNKNTLYIVFAAVIATAGGFFSHSLSNSSDNIKPNTPLIDFSLPDLTGKQRNITEWQGKIRIINFWATWCPPCLKEIPEFIKLQNEFKSNNIQFIGIAIEDSQSVKEYLDTININYPILVGGDEAIALSHQLGNIVNAVPFTVFVNPRGQVIHRQPGEIDRDNLIKIITPLL
ncbi:MAG: TlpA family protein disulfide reductase [Methylococcales bacterium]|nr:TlpA family protein disulfide reductase [Methylococcales bacterium]